MDNTGNLKYSRQRASCARDDPDELHSLGIQEIERKFQSKLYYSDHRRTVKTWFQFYVTSKNGSKLVALESEPDLFEESQSWVSG
jgi:hypothetical protein